MKNEDGKNRGREIKAEGGSGPPFVMVLSVWNEVRTEGWPWT